MFKKNEDTVQIQRPNLVEATIRIKGEAPLVIHRFSHKTRENMVKKMEGGQAAKNQRTREAVDIKQKYNEARYISQEGWDGFNVSAIRNALIDACRVSGLMMTKAKLSVFAIPDGWDALEPQIGLVRIYGKPELLKMRARVETGTTYITIRPMWKKWEANIRIRYDADQITQDSIANLLSRAGQQVGIGEGRPSSKASNGMGWGLFRLMDRKEIGSKEVRNG